MQKFVTESTPEWGAFLIKCHKTKAIAQCQMMTKKLDIYNRKKNGARMVHLMPINVDIAAI